MPKSRMLDPKPFELSARFLSETITVPILDPVDGTTETGASWTLRSPLSREARDAGRQYDVAHADDATVDIFARIDAQLLAVTAGWDRIALDGEPLACTPANVERVLNDPRLAWIGPQLRGFYLDSARFFGLPRKA